LLPPLANSFWIEPGRLLAGEYPGAATSAATLAPTSAATQVRLAQLINAGISYFIDLTQAGELAPYDHLLPEVHDDGRYLIYVRKTIRDHGIPSPNEMVEILDYIARALEVGHQVYVHCRAGIGRTNTVTGCWLRRRGFAGPEAIEHLNTLWKANARATTWPHVPETHQQEEYVLDWKEPGEDLPLTDLGGELKVVADLRERYRGALLGLAVGDAMGAITQYGLPGQFTAVADMQTGGHWQLARGAWTDDTAITLCVAESLLTLDRCDIGDQLERYRRWQTGGYLSSDGQCVGITAAVTEALHAQDFAEHNSKSARPTAQGLVRVGAVVLYSAILPEQVLLWVEQVVRVTHQAPDVLAAAQYYACLLLAAVQGSSRTSLLADANALLPKVANEPWASLKTYPHRTPTLKGAVVDELLLVLAVLGSTLSYREGLLKLTNMGGDSDIRGALYGQLAGALYGIHNIPRGWSRALLRREFLENMADRLLVAALVPNCGAPIL